MRSYSICRKVNRRGNMLLVVILLTVSMLSATALLKFSVAQRNDARKKTEDIGLTNTYISMANVCAGAFCSDLESLSWVLTVADIDHLYGVSNAQYGIEIYDKAIVMFQNALQVGESQPDGKWTYQLDDPYLALEYAGLQDAEALRYLSKQLDGASLSVVIHSPFVIHSEDDDTVMLEGEDKLSIEDIVFTLQLRKGTWMVEQSYRLSGEKLVGRYGDAQIRFSIDNSAASCQLVSQTVTRANVPGRY